MSYDVKLKADKCIDEVSKWDICRSVGVYIFWFANQSGLPLHLDHILDVGGEYEVSKLKFGLDFFKLDAVGFIKPCGAKGVKVSKERYKAASVHNDVM